MSDDAAMSVVAHGLLNTTAVLAGSAATLRRFSDRVSADDRSFMVSALEEHSAILLDGLDVLRAWMPAELIESATLVSLASSMLSSAAPADVRAILDGLVEGVSDVAARLQALVRGLPPELSAFLDSLDERPAGGTAPQR